jgi:shikimate dehydrogenase
VRLRATTVLAGVIGEPVRHSLSPIMHNAAFEALGLDWAFLAFEVPAGCVGRALNGVRALGIAGLSVTMPHKAAVADAVDELTPAAEKLGAVNCVVNERGRLIGHNTDGPGFVDALAHDGFSAAGRSCVVLGAGGAARAVISALAEAGAAQVVVVNRTTTAAHTAAALAGPIGRVGDVNAVRGADLVVNATSVGMDAPGELPLDPDLLAAHQVVADLVYLPVDTGLLKAARAVGAVAVDGVGMLTHQAARAFALWTGQAAPIEVMITAARRELRNA